ATVAPVAGLMAVYPVGTLRVPVRRLKSPFRSALVGRLRCTGAVSCRMILYSWPTKKKSLSFLIGPLKFQPKLLKRSFGFFGAEKKLRASSLSLRINSKALPCHSLPPPRVTTLTEAPALRPYSAEKFEV